MTALPSKNFPFRTAHWIPLVAAVAVAVLVSPVQAETDVLSIQDFRQLKPNWETFAEAKTGFRLEGRYSSTSGSLIRFRKCELLFRMADGRSVPPLAGSSQTVEVQGHLAMPKGRPVFVVEKLQQRPSDLEQFRAKRSRLDRDKPQPWYALGDWAAGRGDFYDDKKLLEQGRQAYKRAVALERESLAEDNPEELLKLAAKAKRLDLAQALQQELKHEAYRRMWQQHRKEKAAGRPDWLKQMAEDLPGCRRPLPSDEPELRRRYQDDPETVYRDASSAERSKLHRLFHNEIVLADILAAAAEDGSNGFQIAEAIDGQVPERHSLAEEFRDRALHFKLKQIATFNRNEVQQLAKQLENRDQPDKAREALTKWVRLKQQNVNQKDAEGLRQVAEDYLNLLNDKQKAAELLIQAYRNSPQPESIARQLETLGYRRKNGEWMTAAEASRVPEDPIEKAMQAGRPAVGMTPEQVRKTLGAPDSVTRIVSRQHLNAVWIYELGSSRLAVHFLRRRLRRGAAGKVVEIDQIDR